MLKQRLLSDRYRLIKPIAKGGFGETFLAIDEHKPSKPNCVIKQLNLQALQNSEQGKFHHKIISLFQEEAAILEQLGDHPQIPSLLAYFTENNQHYIAQEYIPGNNLSQQIKENGLFQEAAIKNLLTGLLPLLNFIHDHNIIHRDIKPENIIYRHHSSTINPWVLVDFGAAKSIDRISVNLPLTMIGTIGYIAPEQIMGQVSFASDIYSLGVSCLYLLTGKNPSELYHPENGWQWTELNTKVSDRLKNILQKMIAIDPQNRYKLATDVLQDLEQEICQTSDDQSWDCHQIFDTKTLWVFNLAVHPQYPIIVSANHGSIAQIWEREQGKIINTIIGHCGSVLVVKFSADGHILATGGVDGIIKLWNLEQGTLIYNLIGHTDSIASLDFTDDGLFLASSSYDHKIQIWSVETGKLLTKLIGHQDGVLSLHYQADENLMISTSLDNYIAFWSVTTSTIIDKINIPSQGIYTSSLHPNRSLFATGHGDGKIRIWDKNNKSLNRLINAHERGINSLTFNYNGSILASGSTDKTIKLWHYPTYELITTLTGHRSSVLSLTFTSDNQELISGSQDGTIRIWRNS